MGREGRDAYEAVNGAGHAVSIAVQAPSALEPAEAEPQNEPIHESTRRCSTNRKGWAWTNSRQRRVRAAQALAHDVLSVAALNAYQADEVPAVLADDVEAARSRAEGLHMEVDLLLDAERDR